MPTEVVVKLHQKLAARYGSLFYDRYGGVPADILIEEWSHELAGLRAAELNRGLEGCRTLKFPPTLPEFLALCRPPIDAQAAYSEAVRNIALRGRGENPAWTHPAIYWAAVDVSFHDMQTNSYPQIKSRWEDALSRRMGDQGLKPIPVAHTPLPPPSSAPPAPEVMAALRGLINKMRVK